MTTIVWKLLSRENLHDEARIWDGIYLKNSTQKLLLSHLSKPRKHGPKNTNTIPSKAKKFIIAAHCHRVEDRNARRICIYTIHTHQWVVSYFSTGEHTHVEKTVNAIKNDAIRNKIVLLARGNMLPLAIQEHLQAEFSHDQVPKIRSIRNFLNRQSLSRNAESISSIGEIVRWMEQNAEVPDMRECPFVLNYESPAPGVSQNKRFVRFVMTSKLLLQNATKSNIIHVDATYKLLWNGFPVLVLGTTDKNRQFHLISIGVSTNETEADFAFMLTSLKTGIEHHLGEKYEPTVLVLDAAGAIHNAFDSVFPDSNNIKVMCFYHVKANMKKQTLSTKANWDIIKDDVNQLQLAPSKAAFEKACECFIKKWRVLESDFCDYFERIWLDRNCNWYEGVQQFTPSTNNALEAFNSVIKRDFTFRKKLHFGDFTNVMRKIINTISEKYVSAEKSFALKPTLNDKDFRSACEWLKMSRSIFERKKTTADGRTIYIQSSTCDNGQFGVDLINKYTHTENPD